MKRWRAGGRLAALLAAVLALGLLLAACGKKQEPAAQPGGGAGTGEQPLKVALVVNGTLGDKSFFDSANAGIERAKQELGIEAEVIEAGNQPSEWEPALRDAAEGDYDVIIVGTWQMLDHVQKVAPEHPDKKFVVFDTAPEKPEDVLPNVYYILYKQNEGSFLAGAFAALVTTSTELQGANPDKVIGMVGGMDIPVINDFRVGYEQGAKYVDPEVQVLVSYAENFSDPAKGKELALAQFNQGADIVFNVAGGTGLGVLEAAKEAGKYAIGVDSNQNYLHPGHVLTSMLKRVDNSLFRALSLAKEGKLPVGQVESLGIDVDAVGLAKDEYYNQYVPQSIRDKMEEIESKLRSGEIQVDTVFK